MKNNNEFNLSMDDCCRLNPIRQRSQSLDYKDLVNAIERYGSSHEDICKMVLGVSREVVSESVIIAPWWEPKVYKGISQRAEFIGAHANARAWNLKQDDLTITYIKTGIGAPLVADVVLALGLCDCERILFVGSVGALDVGISIGDLVIPEYSVCGDGVSRYLKGERLAKSDTFGEKSFPNKGLFEKLEQSVEAVCDRTGVKYHIGRVFSIDTIFAQFAHIGEILEMGCNVIEMETAAAFRAAELAGIPMAALFSVSDNTLARKSLMSGRTEKEMRYRKEVRRSVFPDVWKMLFGSEYAM